ncbi:MAG: MMPL family transporter [Spirochaetes bacterium]|nr:MMPL family transporter [Spirochaetota bacterium]
MRNKILEILIHFAVNRRKIIYLSTAVITVVMLIFSFFLKMDMRWTALLPQNLPIVKQFVNIDTNFLQPANMIIAVSGEDPVMLEKITDEITALLNRELVADDDMSMDEIKSTGRYARYIYGKLPEEWLERNALKLIKPYDTERIGNIFSDSSLAGYLRGLNDDFESEYTDAENVADQERQIVSSLNGLENFINLMNKSVHGEDVPEIMIVRSVRDLTTGNPYMLSLDSKMALIMVASAIPSDDAQTMILIDYRIEDILRPLQQKYPEYRIERTGMTAIGRDEMDSIGSYTAVLTFFTFVLIFIFLMWNYRSITIPLLNLLGITAGIIWTMGIIAITIGTLNLITSMMMIVLLGLGIDFTIHLSTRFQEEISRGNSIENALRVTIRETGKGVITGALTTSAAFYALMIADTPAIVQFGFCSGTGILLTLLSGMWLLPAFLASRIQSKLAKGKEVRKIKDLKSISVIAVFMNRHSGRVVAVSVILFILGIWGGSKIDWEWNFMNLEPEGLRSIGLMDEIVDRYKLSVTTSMLTVPGIEESRKLSSQFKAKNVVGDVNDISQYISRPDFDEALVHLKNLKVSARSDFKFSDPDNPDIRQQLAEETDRLWANLVEIQALSVTGGQDRIVEKISSLIGDRDTRDNSVMRKLADDLLNGNADWKNLKSFSDTFSHALNEKILRMTENLDPVKENDIPKDILAQFKSKKGDSYLIHILPKKNLYTRKDLESFQSVVSSVAKGVTGNPQLILKMNTETMREGGKAVLAAAIAIFFLLLVDFKRPLIALLTFLPLFGSISLTLGIMYIFKQKFNYINMIALPVILGIGIDDGVHLMHRYLEGGRESLEKSCESVGRAIFLTTVTTMLGFGCLMFYLMRGMASMGFVLFFGVGFCFLITITLLPALIKIFDKIIFRKK